MVKKKILVLEKQNFPENYLNKKINNNDINYFSGNKNYSTDYDIIFCRLKYKLNEKFLLKYNKLKYICSPTTGLNHIDLNFCKKNKIKVINLKTKNKEIQNITSTSEYTFALILSLIRNIPQSLKHLSLGGKWDRNLFLSKDFSEVKVGIIGFGRIGQNLFKMLKMMNINTIINDTNISKPIEKKYNIENKSLDYLLKNSDVVTIHINYKEENKNFIDENFLNKLKKNCILINTSRGEIIDELSLLKHLKKNKRFFAALDVLDNETNDKIYSNKILKNIKKINTILTPHLGGATIKSMNIAEKYVINNLYRVLKND